MKRILLLLLTTHLSLLTTYSQAPEKLNYQGVARNSAGETLKTTAIEIKFGILAGSASGTLVWEETQTTTTNDFGLFSLKIGDDGATQTGGSLSSFSEIDWAATQYFLNVQLKVDAGFEDMGTTEMLSVPYAMFAKYAATSGESTTSYWIDGAGVVTTTVDVGVGTASPAGKLDIVGDGDEADEDPLFQVKRKDGETVFAVYPGGVRINVDDSPLKGTKGGFAVGGFSPGKGLTNDYMYVSPDSVRIYVDTTLTKGTKGGFAVGGFSPGKGTSSSLMHLTEDNYLIGHRAGSSITTGVYNSFFGYNAGLLTTEGNSNVFIGHESGLENLLGNWNVFIGNGSGYSNTIGDGNIIMGDAAGVSNTEGSWNVFIGDLAGFANETGSDNVFIGSDAGLSNTIGNYNVFMGSMAGTSNIEGSGNVFLGESAGSSNTYGEDNVFIGTNTGELNSTGNYNVFLGSGSGSNNTTGNFNVFLGESSGVENTTGEENVFIGESAGYNNQDGAYNTFLGTGSGFSNVSGSENVYIGELAGFSNTGGQNVIIGSYAGYNSASGTDNVFIGYGAGYDETGSGKLYIDNANISSNALVYGEFSSTDPYFNINAYTDVVGDMDVSGDITGTNITGGTITEISDINWKTNIERYENALSNVSKLQGVTFNWKDDIDRNLNPDDPQIGLIAQEVEEVVPQLVNTNREGYKSVSYSKLTVVLLEAVKEQQKMIENLQREVELLKQK